MIRCNRTQTLQVDEFVSEIRIICQTDDGKKRDGALRKHVRCFEQRGRSRQNEEGLDVSKIKVDDGRKEETKVDGVVAAVRIRDEVIIFDVLIVVKHRRRRRRW